jgi:hypothetical protein
MAVVALVVLLPVKRFLKELNSCGLFVSALPT